MSEYLVLGGAGFIGSNLTDALINEGHAVTVVDNLSTGKRENLNPQATFYERDLADTDSLQDIGEFDCVFHTAALPRIQPSIKDPIPAHNSNVNGTLNVLEYCRRTDTKIVFSGSSSIYDGKQLPARETSPVEPKNPYTLQKYIGEQYVELYHKLYGLEYSILRYFNVYGERQILEGAYATVIAIFMQQKREGKPLTITSDGEQRRDFTYVGDVVRANLMAREWQGTYNIGAGKDHSINEIASYVGGETIYVPERPGEVRRTLASNYKAADAGWTPNTKVEDWIARNV